MDAGLCPVKLARVPPFRLGKVQVDPLTRRLSHGGRVEILEPRVMQVLVALAQADGAVLSRDELIELCWDGRIVGENAINRAISRIRQAAAQLDGHSFRLETITKVGYRMIVSDPISEPHPEGAAPATAFDAGPRAAGDSDTARAARPFRKSIALAALLAVTMAGALLVGRTFHGRPANGPDRAGASGIALAIVPFAPLSADGRPLPDAAGLTDEIITALSRIPSLRVVSPESGRIEGGGRGLDGVATGYILKGAVRRVGERSRINVQLIDASSAARIWAQSYDGPTGAAAVAQDEIATRIASEIRPQLYNAARRAIATRPVSSFSPWELFLRATWTPGQDEEVSGHQQLALQRRAIAIDPEYGAPHAAIADTIVYTANLDPRWDKPQLWAEADEHARAALRFAPNDPDALLHVVNYHWGSGRLREAAETARRILELDPNDVLARSAMIYAPYSCSPVPQAAIDRLIALNAGLSPDNPTRGIIFGELTRFHLNNRDFDRAVEAGSRSRQIHGEAMASYDLAAALLRQGRAREAIEIVRALREGWPTLSPRHLAEVAIPRRCGGGPNSAYLQGLFRELANAVEAADSAAARTTAWPWD